MSRTRHYSIITLLFIIAASCTSDDPSPSLIEKTLVKREYRYPTVNGNLEIIDSTNYYYSDDRLQSFVHSITQNGTLTQSSYYFVYSLNKIFQVRDSTNTDTGFEVTLNEQDLPLKIESKFKDEVVEFEYIGNLIIINEDDEGTLTTDTLEMSNDNVISRRGGRMGTHWRFEYEYSDKPNPFYKLNISPIAKSYFFSKNLYTRETYYLNGELNSTYVPVYSFDEDGYVTHIWQRNGSANVYFYR